MSVTARLLRIFYRTGAPALPVLCPKANTEPVNWELEAWLLRSRLDAFASDLDRISSNASELEEEFLSSSLSEKEVQGIHACKTLPALNRKGEEIAHLDPTEILLFLKKIPRISQKETQNTAEASPQTKAHDQNGAKKSPLQTEQKHRFGQLILGSLPYPLFAADLEGRTLFFNKLFEKIILNKPPLSKSIRKAEAFFRELCIELLAAASAEGLKKEYHIYEHGLDLEIRMCNIESEQELYGYLFIFENPLHSMETSAWRRRLESEHNYEELLNDFESRLIADSLARNGHNISHTAEDLGIKRSTLQSKIKRLKIKERFPNPKGPIQRHKRRPKYDSAGEDKGSSQRKTKKTTLRKQTKALAAKKTIQKSTTKKITKKNLCQPSPQTRPAQKNSRSISKRASKKKTRRKK